MEKYMLCVVDKYKAPVKTTYFDDFRAAVIAFTEVCTNTYCEVVLADLETKEIIQHFSSKANHGVAIR